MGANDLLQVGLYLAVLLAQLKPLGWHMAQVFQGRWEIAPERWIYRAAGISRSAPMGWWAYATAFLASNAAGLALVYAA